MGTGWSSGACSCCSTASSPCDAAEETSGLLGGFVKSAGLAADTGVVGAFQSSPETDDVSKAIAEGVLSTEDEAVKSPQAITAQLCKTQENGSIPQRPVETQGVPADRDSVLCENSPGEDTEELDPDHGAPIRSRCTLQALEMECATANQEATTEPGVAPSDHLSAERLGLQSRCLESPSVRADILPGSVAPETTCGDDDGGDDDDDDDDDKDADGKSCDMTSVEATPPEAHPASPLTTQATQTSGESNRLLEQPPRSPTHAVEEENDLEEENQRIASEVGSEAMLCPGVPETDLQSASPPLKPRSPDCSASEPEISGPPPASASSYCDQGAKLDCQGETAPAGHECSEGPVEPTDWPTGTDAPEDNQTGSGSSEMLTQDQEADEQQAGGEMTGGMEKLLTTTAADETEQEGSAEDVNSDEDLYRAAEELYPTLSKRAKLEPLLEITCPQAVPSCSVAPPVDILRYCEREWKGSTAKSALIRKGYQLMSRCHGSLRRVRGDNYCALRATLFQVLSHCSATPAWLQGHGAAMFPRELEARDGLLSQWRLPAACQQGAPDEDLSQRLTRYMQLLHDTWRAAAACPGDEERRRLCEDVFQGGEDELGLLEALKLLMLGRAAELHAHMQAGEDVPIFCWLLFARDSSQCPRTFLANHLAQVGFSGGLEQVEMFLLGYTLQCTIQVYRLYMADTEEFLTYYPDDHRDDWPSVCLVTEDDRHYNIPGPLVTHS